MQHITRLKQNYYWHWTMSLASNRRDVSLRAHRHACLMTSYWQTNMNKTCPYQTCTWITSFQCTYFTYLNAWMILYRPMCYKKLSSQCCKEDSFATLIWKTIYMHAACFRINVSIYNPYRYTYFRLVYIKRYISDVWYNFLHCHPGLLDCFCVYVVLVFHMAFHNKLANKYSSNLMLIY